jgi:hypothetical protein
VLCGWEFSIVSRRAAYVSNPPGVKETGGWGLRKVSESTFNALSYFLSRSPRATFATSVSTRESILFRVPPFSQCFRGG